MIPLGNDKYLCKFCNESLKKRVCFVPSCSYYSGARQVDINDQKTLKQQPKRANKINFNNNNKSDKQNWPRFHAIIAYDGYDYNGWQSQPHKNTIQDLIEWRLSSYFKLKINVNASSRTDSKVHANGQSIHFDAPFYSYVCFLLCKDNKII